MEEAEGRFFSILGRGGNFVNTLLDSKGVLWSPSGNTGLEAASKFLPAFGLR